MHSAHFMALFAQKHRQADHGVAVVVGHHHAQRGGRALLIVRGTRRKSWLAHALFLPCRQTATHRALSSPAPDRQVAELTTLVYWGLREDRHARALTRCPRIGPLGDDVQGL